MKKLIMAAAAITAGFAMADVVSSSVVGYQQNAVDAGYKMITPTFLNVGGGEYDIDDFQVVGADDTMANISVMSPEGQWLGQYFWYNEFVDGDTTYPAGWFDITGDTPAGVTLEPGVAVMFNTSVAGASAQSAGQVAGEQELTVPSGYVMLGNASPVTIDIDDFKVVGADDTMVNISVMSAEGSWTGQYFWYNEFVDGATTYPAGWFDITGDTPAGITLEAGASVMVNTALSGVTITIPSAL